MIEEEWKDVVGWEGLYRVSDMGNVFNVRYGRLCKQSKHSKGYLTVSVSRSGKARTKLVHLLVLGSFQGEKKGKQCNHKDGDKTNNKNCNLEWSSVQENINHKFRNRDLPTGVSIERKYYRADITLGGKVCYLGVYETKQDARQAYMRVSKFMGLVESKYARQ